MSDEQELAKLEAVDNQMDKLIETAKAESELAPVGLLEGWSVQRRSYGVGTCFGGSGDVLCYGKWGVIGGTGSYKILHPTGWIEDRPKFKTELEAMLWVMKKDELWLKKILKDAKRDYEKRPAWSKPSND